MPNTTTTNGAAFLTVPANTLWTGHVTLSASLVTDAGAQATKGASPSVTVSGAGGNFADGDTVLKLTLNTPAQVLGALSGNVDHGNATVGPIVVQARSTGPISLVLNTGGATTACATAIGEM